MITHILTPAKCAHYSFRINITMSDTYISLYQGDSWVIPVRLSNPDGTAYDLTGTTVVGHLLVGKSTTVATTSPQTETRLLANGQVQFVIAPAITATVPGDPPMTISQYFATRLQIVTIDSAGDAVTRGVINIRVLVP
jgi:hypothetical protein